MAIAKKKSSKEQPELLVEIGDPLAKEWSGEKLAGVKAFIKKESAKRTPEERIRMELRGLRFKIEEYLEESSSETRQVIAMEAFLKECLAILDITFKRFAGSIDMTDGNLKKYLSGERRFNIDLAMKFGAFFHIPAELWLKVQLKNELIELHREKKQVNLYKKYDYEKVLVSGYR